jgi:hypothetical protein
VAHAFLRHPLHGPAGAVLAIYLARVPCCGGSARRSTRIRRSELQVHEHDSLIIGRGFAGDPLSPQHIVAAAVGATLRVQTTTLRLLRGAVLKRLARAALAVRCGCATALGEELLGQSGRPARHRSTLDRARSVASGASVAAAAATLGVWRSVRRGRVADERTSSAMLALVCARSRSAAPTSTVRCGRCRSSGSCVCIGHWLRDNSAAHGSKKQYRRPLRPRRRPVCEQFLDPSMTYSSAWSSSTTGQSLADAQQAKLRRLCQLVDLQAGDRLLEIGTGWGSLALPCAAGEFRRQRDDDDDLAEPARRGAAERVPQQAGSRRIASTCCMQRLPRPGRAPTTSCCRAR